MGSAAATMPLMRLIVVCLSVVLAAALHIVQTSRDGRSRYAHTWKMCYPHATITCYDDKEVQRFIAPTRWADVWNRLTGVQQADVFRYWFLYHHGGIYADTDVSCNKPLPRTQKLLVGLESNITDEREANLVKMLPHGQFVQWTIAAYHPKHPAFRAVLDRIFAQIFTPHSNSIMHTLSFTGPFAWTKAVRQHINDTVILPQIAFACGGYSSPTCDGTHYVQHHFAGSWKVGL